MLFDDDSAVSDKIKTLRDVSSGTNSAIAGADIEMTAEKEKQEPPRKLHERSVVKEHLTTLTHICTFSYTLLIVYLCLKRDFVFFTWHPLLLSIGWMFIMCEAVLIFNHDSVLRPSTSTIRVRSHWILLLVSVVLSAIGVLVAFVNKNRLNKEHFTSWHAIFGIVGLACMIPPLINGIPLLYKRELKDYVKPAVIKFIHIVSGGAAFVFGGLAIFLSLYTNWFAKNTDRNGFIFSYGIAMAVFPLVWTLVKPARLCYRTILMKI